MKCSLKKQKSICLTCESWKFRAHDTLQYELFLDALITVILVFSQQGAEITNRSFPVSTV